MDWNSVSDEDFRAAFREWLTKHYPEEWRQTTLRPFFRLRGAQQVTWLRMLHDGGWRAPSWPREYGGLGLSFPKQQIYQEELERQKAARVIDLGEQMLGPIVMRFGSEEQKAAMLPRILNCENIWCQGYSEPGAGSDLASLQTFATLEPDGFVVNGQKIWTTFAQHATHMFALVRTGRFNRKQDGISFLLIDLRSPGIDIRAIMNIAGEEEFCEVFFTDVRVPRSNLVGDLHGGWSIAKALLGHERIWVGSPALCRRAFSLACEVIHALNLKTDESVVNKLAALGADLHDYQALYESVCLQASRNGELGPDVVMLKVLATELQQRICDFTTAIAEEYAGVVGESEVAGLKIDMHWLAMMVRPITIFGGANAVQRDILARIVLQLPSS
jgi:3-oxochol-4-en-24-oyl-CoA dehydrogenase